VPGLERDVARVGVVERDLVERVRAAERRTAGVRAAELAEHVQPVARPDVEGPGAGRYGATKSSFPPPAGWSRNVFLATVPSDLTSYSSRWSWNATNSALDSNGETASPRMLWSAPGLQLPTSAADASTVHVAPRSVERRSPIAPQMATTPPGEAATAETTSLGSRVSPEVSGTTFVQVTPEFLLTATPQSVPT